MLFFFFNDTPPTEIYTLSLHDALPILNFRLFGQEQLDIELLQLLRLEVDGIGEAGLANFQVGAEGRSEEHTSELQSRFDLVCRLLLEKKKKKKNTSYTKLY